MFLKKLKSYIERKKFLIQERKRIKRFKMKMRKLEKQKDDRKMSQKSHLYRRAQNMLAKSCNGD